MPFITTTTTTAATTTTTTTTTAAASAPESPLCLLCHHRSSSRLAAQHRLLLLAGLRLLAAIALPLLRVHCRRVALLPALVHGEQGGSAGHPLNEPTVVAQWRYRVVPGEQPPRGGLVRNSRKGEIKILRGTTNAYIHTDR